MWHCGGLPSAPPPTPGESEQIGDETRGQDSHADPPQPSDVRVSSGRSEDADRADCDQQGRCDRAPQSSSPRPVGGADERHSSVSTAAKRDGGQVGESSLSVVSASSMLVTPTASLELAGRRWSVNDGLN